MSELICRSHDPKVTNTTGFFLCMREGRLFAEFPMGRGANIVFEFSPTEAHQVARVFEQGARDAESWLRENSPTE